MTEAWHISRLWSGGDKERFPECVCEGLPCGYVVEDIRCLQHSVMAGKTFRSAHSPENCPAKEDENAG